VLATHEALENLELQNNDIKDEGATALANSLKRNFEIEVVNLCGNLFGTAGAMKLRASAGDVIVLDMHVPTADIGDVTPMNRPVIPVGKAEEELESAATPKQGPDRIATFLANATRMIEMDEMNEKGMKDLAL
jgi:DNA-binding NarL/FixJ family response regulator